MSRIVTGLGFVFIFMGPWILFFPDQLVSIVDWGSRQGQYVAAGIRIVVGLVLVLSASSTRYPKGFRILGGLALFAGLGLPFIAGDIWEGLIQWWLVENLIVYRVCGAAVVMMFGALLVYATLPRRTAA